MNTLDATAHAFAPRRYAAIDIGTVTCRLLVADVDSAGAVHEVFRDRDITNLGVGVDETGRLAPDAIERVGTTIDRFASEITQFAEDGADLPVMAVATSAARDAQNAEELISRLARAGVMLSIVPGETEAGLSFMGATSVFSQGQAVVIDVGGGSTEIIAGTTGQPPARAHSFQLGCRRVTERFFKTDPPSPQSMRDAASWIRSEVEGYLDELRQANLLDGRVIAVAGTATNVISMRDRMAVYQPNVVHGSVAHREDIDNLVETLGAMTLAERQKVVGLESRRAPVIVAGVLILQQIMEAGRIPEFTVSESDILQGIILHMARSAMENR